MNTTILIIVMECFDKVKNIEDRKLILVMMGEKGEREIYNNKKCAWNFIHS